MRNAGFGEDRCKENYHTTGQKVFGFLRQESAMPLKKGGLTKQHETNKQGNEDLCYKQRNRYYHIPSCRKDQYNDHQH